MARHYGHLGGEGAVAFAIEHAHRVTVMVSDGDIELALAVQIPDRDGIGVYASCVVLLCKKGAISISEQHAQGAVASVRDREVELAVAVQIRSRHRLGVRAYEDLGSKRGVGVAEQHTHGIA